MRLTLPRMLLLALALLLGQGLAVAHSFDHSALTADNACGLCVHAHKLGTGAATALPAPTLLLAGTHEAPQAPALIARPGAVLPLPPIRGPPGVA